MKIAVITAMPEETAAVLKKASNSEKRRQDGRMIIHGRLFGHDVLLAESGMGMLNAGWGAAALTGKGVDLIISAGFGGAVKSGLQVGNVVMARNILQLHGNDLETVCVGFYGQNSIAESLSLPLGTFISCDTILNKRDLAGLLPDECTNPVVEMETAAIARVAAQHGTPFLALRSISDPWNEELDFSIDEFCDDSMQIRIPKVLRTIAQRPHIIPQLIRLARNSRIAAKALSTAMEQLLKQI
ncbi:MAG TPA: hypothetical protein PLN25_04135 [Deltaproteobacteria bacterium]|nr:hypothetical protein [Deltaproteobacteria bacterium]HQB39848.1 hypothetical protein [Deltaproteobacteria bacterium]